MSVSDILPFTSSGNGNSPVRGGKPLHRRVFANWIRKKKDGNSVFSSLIRATRQNLTAARSDYDYDEYLSMVAVITLFLTLFSGVIALAGIVLFASELEALKVGINFPPTIARVIEQHEFMLQVLLIVPTVSVVIGVITGGILLYLPRYYANERKRSINNALPFFVFYLLTLSKGGRNILGVIEEGAKANDIYGEAAEEFAAIHRTVKYTKKDLVTALYEQADATPSDEMADLYDNMRAAVQTGGNIEDLFQNRSERVLKQIEQKIESRLQFVELLSEVYVQGTVIPLFMMIITISQAFLGNSDMSTLYMMVYLFIPIFASVIIFVTKLVASRPSVGDAKIEETGIGDSVSVDTAKDIDNPLYERLKRHRKWAGFKRLARHPLSTIYSNLLDQPYLTAGISIPLGAFVAYLFFQANLVEYSFQGFKTRPLYNMLVGVCIPVLLALLPVDLINLRAERKRKKINKLTPDMLEEMKRAAERGRTLNESLERYARTNENALANELEKGINQSNATGRISPALINVANNLKVPRLSRTIKMLTKANESSKDVRAVLEITEQDNRTQNNLDSKQESDALMYVAIIAIINIVFMGVLKFLQSSFLASFSDLATGGGGGGAAAGGAGGSLNVNIDLQTFEMLFFHASVISGFFGGIVAATIWKDNPLGGIKLGTAAIIIATLIFALL